MNGPLLYLVAALKWADHFVCMALSCVYFSFADLKMEQIPLACLTMLNFCYFVLVNPFRMIRSYFCGSTLKLVPMSTWSALACTLVFLGDFFTFPNLHRTFRTGAK